jgi:hypothetical protein
MRLIRATIAGLMGAVLITALGLTALRSASEIWAGAVLLTTCSALGLAVIGVVCRSAAERAWWLGTALFGWGYLAMAFWSPVDATRLPTFALLEYVCKTAGIAIPTKPALIGLSAGIDSSFLRIAHCLWASLAASLGGIVAGGLFAIAPVGTPRTAIESHEPIPSRRDWRHPMGIGLTGMALVGMVAVAGSGWPSTYWAGATFLLTCGLLGLAALGALLGRGRLREVWLGAALFGWGYLILAFGWHPYLWACPKIVTAQVLETFRPWLPSSVSGIPAFDNKSDPECARILKLLEEPVPMHFPNSMTLEELLNHVKKETTHLDGKGIPIYVDPIGLQEAERSMSSTIGARIDRDDIPLKSSLHLCLRQLQLAYRVKDGFLQIIYDDDERPIIDDSFLIVGHSLFGLIVAALGGAAAPLVAGGKGSL